VFPQFTISEPEVGPFACIPIAHQLFPLSAIGAVCTLVSSGRGFRITAGKISHVSTISPGPHPPCTRAALSAALERYSHKRSLAPSYLARGWKCVGSFALAQLIDVDGRMRVDVTVVFHAAGRAWRTVNRGGNVCTDGVIPARIWLGSCAVN
jgi:hypothetical protein